MGADDTALIALGLAAVGTYAFRAFPVTMISRLTLPDYVRTWLVFVAESVITGFVALFLFWDVQAEALRITPATLFGTTVVVAVHLWRDNLLVSVFAGVAAYWLLDTQLA